MTIDEIIQGVLRGDPKAMDVARMLLGRY